MLLELCTVDCGSHGRCSAQRCLCDRGWSGTTCNRRDCDPRCTASSHGHCNNGTCICQPGWNGKHCTLGQLVGLHSNNNNDNNNICKIETEGVLFSTIQQHKRKDPITIIVWKVAIKANQSIKAGDPLSYTPVTISKTKWCVSA